jgi:hypothetical protein
MKSTLSVRDLRLFLLSLLANGTFWIEMMKQLLSITDPVRLTYLEALLKGAGIHYVVNDRNISDLMAGSNTLFPMRIMVAGEDANQAKRVLTEAEQYYDD